MNKKYEEFLDLVIYQVYPRSFKDSNDDGIGDIPGLMGKLDYLKELGINAIWICPCYKSPNHDNGYDISDYCDIMDEFGTMEDMRALIREMHARDMKLIMDLVPNHTSDEHKWFIESRKSKDNPYSDYYYWADEPVNNWDSMFGGTAWEYDKIRGQYYLHSYTVQQPDLNWDNPAVVKEMQDIVDFWIDQGVDGFRCDVIDQISKDFEGGRNCFGPNLHKYIHALFGREKAAHLFTVGECWAGDIEEIKLHIAEERGELSTLFQFDHLEVGRSENKFIQRPGSLAEVRDILIKWQMLTQESDLLYSLFTDNHDNSIFISRVANDRELRYESATCLAAMFYLLRGVPFIYQGQEFGITSSSYEDIAFFDDIESINAYNACLAEGSTKEEALAGINFGGRDNARRPMSWDSSGNGGFSKVSPWIPLGSRAKEINLEEDLKAEKSVFRFYQALLKLRKENAAFRQGKFKVLSQESDSYFIYERILENDRFTVVCNFENNAVIADRKKRGTLVLSNYTDTANDSDIFRPYEIAVYKEIN